MSPRRARVVEAGHWFHVVNRAVDRRQIFFQDSDYEMFLVWLRAAARRYPVVCGGYCVMPNHFHLLLQPEERQALSAYMQFASGCHACDLRAFTGTRGYGHVYQSRFWSRPIDGDHDFLRTLRYVEGNALRAKLVRRAEDWPWCSLRERLNGEQHLIAPPPLTLPEAWADLVNAGCTSEELEAIRPRTRRIRATGARKGARGTDPNA